MAREDKGWKVFVGNLSFDTHPDDLRHFFRGFGVISDAWVARKPPGFGFAWFQDERDARDAVKDMDGRECRGNRVRVELSKGSGNRGGGGGGYGDRDRGYDRSRRGRSPSPRRGRSRSPRARDKSRSRSPRRGSPRRDSPLRDSPRRRSPRRSPQKGDHEGQEKQLRRSSPPREEERAERERS